MCECKACAAFDAAERHAIQDLPGDLPTHTLGPCVYADKPQATMFDLGPEDKKRKAKR